MSCSSIERRCPNRAPYEFDDNARWRSTSKGIGHRGWLRFELLGVRNTDVDQVQFGLVLVDSFDGRHTVVRQELDPLGRIRERPGPRVIVL
jgi:hypothetical protein